MKGLKIVALTNRGREALKNHVKQRLKMVQKMVMNQVFKTSFDGVDTFIMEVKGQGFQKIISFEDCKKRILEEFSSEGCKESDFGVSELA